VQEDHNFVLSSYKWVVTESQLFAKGFKNQIQNLKSFKFEKKYIYKKMMSGDWSLVRDQSPDL
jgi:hypothetical protein